MLLLTTVYKVISCFLTATKLIHAIQVHIYVTSFLRLEFNHNLIPIYPVKEWMHPETVPF